MRKALAMAAAGSTIAAGMLSVAATANAATVGHPSSAPTSTASPTKAPTAPPTTKAPTAPPSKAPKAPTRKAPTTLTAKVSAQSIKTHGRSTISGTLSSDRKALAREVVALDIINGRKVTTAESAFTNSRGIVSFVVSPKATTTYELVFAGTHSYAASHSGTVTVRVIR